MEGTSVKAALLEGYRVENRSRDLEWFADEPESIGGTNTAPKPSELLLSALTSCKLITMRMYAERKGWDVSGLKVDLQILEMGEKTIVSKKIIFPENLDEKQRERLTEISGRCPVAKMVKDSIEYVIS
ncbi:MAG: OsmC family protein [Crocinitomicaceae bacterium]